MRILPLQVVWKKFRLLFKILFLEHFTHKQDNIANVNEKLQPYGKKLTCSALLIEKSLRTKSLFLVNSIKNFHRH